MMRALHSLPPALSLLLGGCAGTWGDQAALVRSLEHELAAARMDNERLEARAATCAPAADAANPLYVELRQVFADRPVEVLDEGASVALVVPAAELLDQQGLRVRAEGRWALDLLATALGLHPEVRLHIEVHTSDAPPPRALARSHPDNWALSAAGAAAVAAALVQDHAVAPARLTASGRADGQPVADNVTPEGQRANHRVVFHLHPGTTP